MHKLEEFTQVGRGRGCVLLATESLVGALFFHRACVGAVAVRADLQGSQADGCFVWQAWTSMGVTTRSPFKGPHIAATRSTVLLKSVNARRHPPPHRSARAPWTNEDADGACTNNRCSTIHNTIHNKPTTLPLSMSKPPLDSAFRTPLHPPAHSLASSATPRKQAFTCRTGTKHAHTRTRPNDCEKKIPGNLNFSLQLLLPPQTTDE